MMLPLFQVVKALLEKGEDPNKALSNGDPALFTAIEKEYKDVLRVLIEGICCLVSTIFNKVVYLT